MTNKEYVSEVLFGFGITESQIDIIIGKAKLNPNDNVDYDACDTAIYNRLSLLLPSAFKNITEGGWAQSWNMEAVKMYYQALCNELGLPNILDQKPKVEDISNRW